MGRHYPQKWLSFRSAPTREFFKGRKDLFELATTEESFRRIVDELRHPVQEALVEKPQVGNHLILAGPGSGKTRVIVHRIAYLVRVRRIAPDRIIALAFNRSAVIELKRRLYALVGNDALGVTVMTYHAMALRLTGTSLSAAAQTGHDIDFGKLLADAVALLEGTGEAWSEIDDVRERLLQGYEYIFVDEYQDIDEQQYALVSALAGRRRPEADTKLSIMAVGDDDQNIYSFKGASVEFIRRFQRDYGGDITYLVENFRSTQNIISAANHVIQQGLDRMKVDHPIRINDSRQKDPQGGRWEAIDAEGQGRVRLISAPVDPNCQAQLAIIEIERIRRLDPQIELSEIALVARTHRSLEPLRAACDQLGLRYQLLTPEANAARLSIMQSREGCRTAGILRRRRSKLTGARAVVRWVQGQFAREPQNPYWEDLLAAVEEFAGQASANRVPASELLEALYEAGGEAKRHGQKNAIRLMTAHGTKGLEFRHVVILDCGDWNWRGDDERRLLYVAMTRAKETLTLMKAEDGRNAGLADLSDLAGVLHQLPTVRPVPKSELDRRYVALGPSDVDLGYAGRRPPSDSIHRDLGTTAVGDPVRIQDRLVQTLSGRTIGKLAAKTTVPGGVLSAHVAAVMVRTKARTDPKYLERVKSDSWEAPLIELVVEPDPRGADTS